MSTVKYGYSGKILLNSGSYGTPTWNEASAVADVEVEASFSEQDATTRQGGGLTEAEPTLLTIALTGKIRTDETDTTGFVAMETAFLTRASLDVLMLDGGVAVNGSRGYRMDMKNFTFGESQGNDGLLYRSFSFKKCVSNNPAKKAVVTAGAPVFTTL